MKDRIGMAFYVGIVFTMCAVAVRLLLLVFGVGLAGISLSCLALAFILFVLLYGINPQQ